MPIQQMFLGLGGSDGTQMSASGGTTNDYTESGSPYRSHTFTSSGSFSVSSLGTGRIGDVIDVLVVAGGGGGGYNIGGGGGAGGVRVMTEVPVAAASYSITIGGGGAGDTTAGAPHTGGKGSASNMSISPSGPFEAEGGGGGGSLSLVPLVETVDLVVVDVDMLVLEAGGATNSRS